MSNKTGAISLSSVLKAKGIRHIVLCPGSRNAPLIDVFTNDDAFQCFSIVDERSAGFFALGISQMTQQTVAVCCTSGSALLNLAPAVAEAHFQRRGLLIISADRPQEWVNQGESQTIDQFDVFRNYVRGSFSLVQEPNSEDDLWFHEREINEAIHLTQLPLPGPVHINIPFKEPLYQNGQTALPSPKIFEIAETQSILSTSAFDDAATIWNASQRIMIICGQGSANNHLLDNLAVVAEKGIVVLTESTSNLYHSLFFPCIDKLIIPRNETEGEQLKPELLITLGGPIISRKVKAFLRKHKPTHHWHVDLLQPGLDAFQSLTKAFRMNPSFLISSLVGLPAKSGDYYKLWDELRTKSEAKHQEFFQTIPYSDFKVFDLILKTLPENAILQIGNSSAIRYAQLFESNKQFRSYCNRGTSGIEGAVSTAAGAAAVAEENVFHISGDLSLMYDSNGFWNKYIGRNFKTIVINNGGGGIFRIIDGPSNLKHFEEYVEASNLIDFKHVTQLYHLHYLEAIDESSLEKGLQEMLSSDKPVLLEIKTPKLKNDKVLKHYFDHLKTVQ